MVTLDDSARITEIWPEEIALEILYEDAELLAVNKPSGMLVHPTSRERTGTAGNALLGMGHGDVRFLHRLDRGTSGVLLAAKTLQRGSPLAKLFEARAVEKRYVAVLTGQVDWDERVVTLPIGRAAGRRPPWNVLEGGAAAETRLRVLARTADGVVVEALPVTGRTNQIRIHCAATGNPIAGDTAYGAAAAPRLLLHAWKLAFPGLDGEMRRITAPVPAEFPPFTEAE